MEQRAARKPPTARPLSHRQRLRPHHSASPRAHGQYPLRGYPRGTSRVQARSPRYQQEWVEKHEGMLNTHLLAHRIYQHFGMGKGSERERQSNWVGLGAVMGMNDVLLDCAYVISDIVVF